MEAINIGLVVADFLLNTSRILKAIDVYKKCLVFLYRKAGVIEENIVKLLLKIISNKISLAYIFINDYKEAKKIPRQSTRNCERNR